MRTAAFESLAVCYDCHELNPLTRVVCNLCGRKLSLRRPNSVQRCLALVITALLFYIPANLYPIMTTVLLGDRTDTTLVGGVLLFLDHGSYGIAFVIFTASIVIPMAKIAALLMLCMAATRSTTINQAELTRLYRVVEFVGKWSMVDVFVVAILAALVQVGSVVSIEPGIAIISFCITVILTMIAATLFDTRLIWDRLKP